ncbi:MAG TPA: GNAT family N-acetyltransferase [Acidimicrobiales bacterium]|nr:GNAT family N-acetyltransferase [Acidimicrobiales bacterium]
MSNVAIIHTARLQLVPIRADVLTSLLSGDADGAGELQGFSFPTAFLNTVNDAFLKNQLRNIELTPPGQDWGVRAIVRENDGTVIGQCGFHGPPEVVGRAEIGYTIFPDYRDHGYATEAVTGLTDLARKNGSSVIFASVAADNAPSIRVVEKAGFLRTGAQMNNNGDQEYVFEKNL